MVISSGIGPYARLYNTRRWRRMSKHQLMLCPLCVFCKRQDRVTAATVTDHIIPHKGDRSLFFDTTNLQSLCKPCHDSDKAQIERNGYTNTIGDDGWPIDINHPVNKER